MLENLEDWLKTNYKGGNEVYLQDVTKTKKLFVDDYEFQTKGFTYATSNIRQNISKRSGGTSQMYQNHIQQAYSKKAKAHFSKI